MIDSTTWLLLLNRAHCVVGRRSNRRMDKVPKRQWSGAMCYMIRAQCTQLTTSTTLK